MGHSRPLFLYFRLFNTVDSKCSKYFLPMTGFERRTSGIGSDHSTNWATTTTLGTLLMSPTNWLDSFGLWTSTFLSKHVEKIIFCFKHKLLFLWSCYAALCLPIVSGSTVNVIKVVLCDRNFASLAKFKTLWQSFEDLFSIWLNYSPTLKINLPK